MPVTQHATIGTSLFDLAARTEFDFDINARPASALLSEEQIEHIIADYDRLLDAFATEENRETFRQMFIKNLYLGLHLQETSETGYTPGMVTFTLVGDEYIFYSHTDKGPIECLRLDATTVTVCQAWWVSLVATVVQGVCLALGISAVYLSIGRLTSNYLQALIINYPGRQQMLAQIIPNINAVTGSNMIKVLKTIANFASLGSVITNILANMSMWSMAWTIANLVAGIFAIWATGGWYLLYMIAQVALYISQVVQLFSTMPNGCSPPPRLMTMSPFSAVANSPAFALTVTGEAFLEGAAAQWNGQPRQTSYTNGTQVVASINAADIVHSGAYPVTVINPGSNNIPSNGLIF
jgi:hypothetical protein